MTKRLLGIISVVVFGLWFQPRSSASMLPLNAPQLLAKPVTHHLRLSEAGGDIEFEVGGLFEDDGPATGHSYQAPRNQETVTPRTWLKKELVIPNPQARVAYLAVDTARRQERLAHQVPKCGRTGGHLELSRF